MQQWCSATFLPYSCLEAHLLFVDEVERDPRTRGELTKKGGAAAHHQRPIARDPGSPQGSLRKLPSPEGPGEEKRGATKGRNNNFLILGQV